MKNYYSKLSTRFRRVSLYKRLIMLLIMVLILIGLVFVLILRQSYRTYKESVDFEASQLLSNYNHAITDATDTLNSVTKFQIIQNANSGSTIFTQLENCNGSWSNDFTINNEIKNEIKPLFDIGDNISTIAIIDKKAQYIYCHENAMVYRTFEGDPNSDFLIRADNRLGAMIVLNSGSISEPLLGLPEDNLVGIRAIMTLSPRESIGYTLCSIDMSSAFGNFNLGRSFDSEQISYFSEDGARLTGDIDSGILAAINMSHSKVNTIYSEKIKLNGISYITYYIKNKSGSVCLITIPYKDMLNGILGHNILLLIFVIITILILILIAALTINSIRVPIANLTTACETITEGNYGLVIDDNASDEINELVEAFNNMSERTAFLINEVLKKEALQSQTELQLLRSQINPHFMYNTLETIRAAAILSHNDDITDMVSLFGKILRYSISNVSTVVPISQALDYIRDYVSLQQLHYKQDVIVNITVDPGIMDYPILKLILQPIVENCFTHSSRGHNRTAIDIIGYEEYDTITFRITDDGPGVPSSTVESLNNYINGRNEDFHSIGLKNVNRRIKLYYGEEYGLLFEAQENIGTTVTITVPVIREAENDD